MPKYIKKTSQHGEKKMLLTQRYSEQIAGVISCYDRVVIQGTLPGWCFDGGMTAFLNVNKIRIFDYPQFANALREELRSHAEAIAAENNIEIEFIRKIDAFRKDNLRPPARHPSSMILESVCTITSTLLTRITGYVISGFLPGAPSGCSFTSTGTTCSLQNCPGRVSTTN